ncbi:hypothetical protein GCM10010230_25690 [Streptomyces narbonensis]|uniref:hypothetical protein n=1 Tax=Streptomyces narbonensis TaxID=67333 RepID=UPI0016740779|nr:hypothetical protein [Streptomyces narbonensis]GGV99477.1 hypothetical protein GCM10010230_25690 [Streptomyces narbonensis]
MEHARLNVTLRPGPGTLARLAATLSNHHVLDLAYTASSPASATAVVRVPRADAPRAQHKLRRLIDVIDVIDVLVDPASASTAGGPDLPISQDSATGAARP